MNTPLHIHRSRIATFAAARFVRIVALSVIFIAPSSSRAQACLGTPERGGIAYENVRYSIGTGHGGAVTFVPGRVVIGLNGNTRTVSDATSGFEAGGRFAIVLPISRVQLCPGIGVTYNQSTWDVSNDIAVNSKVLAARAGAGLGLEQPVFKGLSIIPSVGAHYQFAVTMFDVSSTAEEPATTGDTVSKVIINYGLLARYRFIYGGFNSYRFGDGQGPRPAVTRFVVGFAFGASGKSRDD